MRVSTSFFSILLVACSHGASVADGVEELVDQGRRALVQGKVDAAIQLATQALAQDAKCAPAFLLRGTGFEAIQQHEKAIADFDSAIKFQADLAEAYNHRGSEQFKLGRFAASLADFDKFLELRPDQFAGHWRRGISCYYAGRFDEGRKQFEGYEKVDTNDVENAIWHYLCTARATSVAEARKRLLKIGADRRVPMMQVYALFAGKMRPEEVLQAVEMGQPAAEQLNQRLFYAHLYLGLYYEVEGDKRLALEHLTHAADDHKIGHYMWDVARVHRDLLRQENKK